MTIVCFWCLCFVIICLGNFGFSDYCDVWSSSFWEFLNHEICRQSFQVTIIARQGKYLLNRSGTDAVHLTRFKAREAFASRPQLGAFLPVTAQIGRPFSGHSVNFKVSSYALRYACVMHYDLRDSHTHVQIVRVAFQVL